MTWQDFANATLDADRVILVGPLLNEPYRAEYPTIYVDGGTRWAQPSHPAAPPQISVGDGDSAKSEMKLDIVLPADKDYSDLAFALEGIPQWITHVEMRGFLGGRRDHELCNLGEVHAFLQMRSHHTVVEIHGDQSRLTAFCKGRVRREIQGLFSVLVLASTPVKISGACKYPLQREKPLEALSSLGLSNEGRGVVEVESGPPVFIVQPS